MLIFLLLILDAHRRFQLLRFLGEGAASTPSIPGTSASDSEALGESPPKMLLEGLVGRGEKAPWLQGPSWACSRKSNVASSRAVISVGRGLLGPAEGPWSEAPSLP